MWKRIAGAIAAVIVLVLGGAYWALYEPSIPRAVLEAKYASAPSQFVVLADGTRVHYRDRGPRNAPVLLLLHGSNASLFDWEEWSKLLSAPEQPQPENQSAIGFQGEMVVQTKPSKPVDATSLDLKGGSQVVLELQVEDNLDPRKLLKEAIARMRAYLDGFRVISVDLPGHGLTGAMANGDYSEAGMAEFVRAFADRLGLAQFALAGNSMGGGVAARFAEMYPDRVTHLIIVDGFAKGVTVLDRVPASHRLAQIPVLSRLLLNLTPRAVVEEGLGKAVVRPGVLTDDMIDRYWDFIRMGGARQATLTRFQLPGDTYVRDYAKALTMPTLILWGADDHLIPVANAAAWGKMIHGAKVIIYPATGHLPMEELPKKSAEDIRSFITGPH